MHVAASNPRYLSAARGAGRGDGEGARDPHRAGAEGRARPPEIVAKMVEGRLRKSLGEITLLGQPFVKDPDHDRREAAEGRRRAAWLRFERFEVGAGIEKKQEDFVAEVMAQVKAAGVRVRRSSTRAEPRQRSCNSPARAGFFPCTTEGRSRNERRVKTARYSRILVKLSGEALLGGGDYGIDPAVLKRIAGELQRNRRRWACRSRSSSAAATSSAARAWRAPAWTGWPPTTWACSPPS